jgi:hypothetical protein
LADQTVAVPGLWSGTRRHFAGTIEPKRPLDRRPDDVEGVKYSGFGRKRAAR